jgi:hypothetical protein
MRRPLDLSMEVASLLASALASTCSAALHEVDAFAFSPSFVYLVVVMTCYLDMPSLASADLLPPLVLLLYGP